MRVTRVVLSYDRRVSTCSPQHWQGERDARAAAEGAVDLDPAAVGLGDRAADGQAEAGPIRLRAPRGIDAIEAVEDVGQVLGRDADPRVGDDDAGLSVRGLAPTVTVPPGGVYLMALSSRLKKS